MRLDLSARFRKPLMAFYRRRTGNSSEAEDFAQEVILRVLQRSDLSKMDKPEAFVFTTARNLLNDLARRAEVRRRNQTEIEIFEDQAEGFSAERVIQSRQELKRALAALTELGEKTHDIFILHRLEGMRYRDIAELYGVSVSAVEKHLIKAFAHLLDRMGKT